MDKEKLMEELNQLLKGCHMGAGVFENLAGKLKSEELKLEFDRILRILKVHERKLTRQINTNGGDAADDAGMMGSMAEMMSKIKNLSLMNDTEVIAEAVKSIEMGEKAIRDFDDSHFTLDEEMQKTIRIMEDDYKSIYYNLHKYLIELK
ncbi:MULTISPECIES: DUF2383 domain-containing protein [Bacillota]|uniref:DUF2383 domain-containing protein n=2 Tax=Amedibacillus TaxID=2749846 RepID=A0A7G9GJC1_9FIRM|nr:MULTISPECIES: DUF2383 domain-containing protein [Bacillota]QNM10903.1 DUF2383 domain-containing protein [[Eubacterium] hominis]MCH4285339.1 PA2169 family four-helix-bundle protein [Amedibacillus hominis]RGB58397.1 DUF2383 domain-containing protein [Absiella sp. AM22-9]RGB63284.1 DUF2383 domain-containing protein [Absiella sp. AM10-20]RGB67114.1 DUF2383 domain-containing protein [Absiella sp. AM09-45]